MPKDSTNDVPLFKGWSETKYTACRKFDLIISHISHMRNTMFSLNILWISLVSCPFFPWNQCADQCVFLLRLSAESVGSTLTSKSGTWGYYRVELIRESAHCVYISYNKRAFWYIQKIWEKTLGRIDKHRIEEFIIIIFFFCFFSFFLFSYCLSMIMLL